MPPAPPPDADDFFADTRMSFGDHIEELRTHLFRAIYGFVIALFFSFFIGAPVLRFITAPVEAQLREFHERRVARIKEEIKVDPNFHGTNKPTPFIRVTFRLDQLRALVEGRPGTEVSAFPRPYVPRPKAESDVSILDRVFGREPVNTEPTHGPDDEPIEPGNMVSLWMRTDNPAEEAADKASAQRRVSESDSLATLSPTEAFMVYFKVCLLCAFVIGSPWIFYQIWAFIAAGLYPHEKRLIHVYLPFSLFLFLGGIALCQFVVIPRALGALLWFNEWLGLKPDLRLSEWLGFALLLPLVFGLSFQTPMVMMFLVKVGIMDVEGFRKQRRIAWFVMAVVAALVTPTPDAITMILLWVPMSLLFELGIYLVARMSPVSDLDDLPDNEEFVGA